MLNVLLEEPALITSVLGPAMLVLLVWLRDRRKSQVTSAKAISEATKIDKEGDATIVEKTLDWATKLSARLEIVETKLLTVERENALLRQYTHILIAQVFDLGGEPAPMPDREPFL